MEALILMVKNTVTNSYHSIIYLEQPSVDADQIIFKSTQGPLPKGFKDRKEAVTTTKQMAGGIAFKARCSKVTLELDSDIEWDGENVQFDIQIRSRVLSD